VCLRDPQTPRGIRVAGWVVVMMDRPRRGRLQTATERRAGRVDRPRY